MGTRVESKVAVITGAASGIGRATAELLAAEGSAALVLIDRDRTGAEATAAALGSECEATVVEADVTDVDAPGEAIAQAVERFGRLDVLVTAAGISIGSNVVDTEPDLWDHVFAVNVKGTYLWMRAAIPAMVEAGGGSVIAIASQLAVSGARNNAAYAASKGAVISLVRTTALDYARTGVRVNSILPGATETPMLEHGVGRLTDPDRARAHLQARHPMRRFGRPEEIAQAALYLASDESSFTTGAEIRVDGGWIAG